MTAGREKMLVTGGAGFIGSNLVEELVRRGEDVRVADNFLTGRRENLADVLDRIELVEADLSEFEAARAACQGVAVIFHLAALPSVPVSMERPLDTTRHNVVATANVLVAARDASARRLVFSSSSSVYGGEGSCPQHEDSPPHPKSPYAAAKLCCEVYVRTFCEAFGMDAVSLRYFNVFGPRQPLRGPYSAVFPAFITRMLAGEPPVIYGDGRQSRDFTYVSNVVRANLLAAHCSDPFAGEVVNVAGGNETSLLELVDVLNATMATSLPPVFEPERPGDVRRTLADISRARELLGYEPEVGFEEGLRQTVDYFRQRTEPPPGGPGAVARPTHP